MENNVLNKPETNRLEANQQLWAWVFLLPCLLGLIVFTYLPTIASLGLSFSSWNLLGTPRWVGVENYQHVLNDPLFWKTLKNTVLFVIGAMAGEVILGFLLAVWLNQGCWGRTFFRAAYFVPFVTPMVSVALVWSWIYDPQVGILNWFLQLATQNNNPIAWLYNERTALFAVLVLQIWKGVGYSMVIFLAGLQSIPTQVYESAELDGAKSWQSLLWITLPMMTPTLFFVSMMTLITGFQTFDSIYLMTQGGPAHSTEVLVYWMFKNAFEFYKVGPASAIAYILFLIILFLTWLQWQFRKKWVLYES